MKDNNVQNSSPVPLARAFLLKELPGWIAKSLEVPPGRRGICMDKQNRLRLFPPGRHPLLSAIERIGGGGAGLRAGYLPDHPFAAWLNAENLLSGDDILLETRLLVMVEVIDPARFFTEQVLPRKQIQSGQVDLSQAEIYNALGTLARRYAAADLICGLPTDRLLPQIQAVLRASLGNQGLGLDTIQFISFLQSEDRIKVAEKVQTMEERLQNIELQKQMAAIENQAQLEDFIKQLDPELVERGGLRPVFQPASAQPDGTPGGVSSLFDSLRARFSAANKQEKNNRHWVLDDLLGRFRKKDEEKLPQRRFERFWWVSRGLWMAFLILMGIGLTFLALWLTQVFSWTSLKEILIGIWSFILFGLLESIKVLYEKREQISEKKWSKPGITYLDDLSGNNRQQVDQIMRDQAQRDLNHIRELLNDVRSRVYRAGNEDLALRIRELERKFESASAHIKDPNFGSAPYLDPKLHINSHVWNNMLDYDELLLIRGTALSEDAQEIQQKASQAPISQESFDQLESRLDAYLHQFENRGRALRSTDAELARYRIHQSQTN